MEISDEMKVTRAAQACLLVLAMHYEYHAGDPEDIEFRPKTLIVRGRSSSSALAIFRSLSHHDRQAAGQPFHNLHA